MLEELYSFDGPRLEVAVEVRLLKARVLDGPLVDANELYNPRDYPKKLVDVSLPQAGQHVEDPPAEILLLLHHHYAIFGAVVVAEHPKLFGALLPTVVFFLFEAGAGVLFEEVPHLIDKSPFAVFHRTYNKIQICYFQTIIFKKICNLYV